MPELKTQKNNASVAKFINSISNDQRRQDAKVLAKLYADVTGLKPTMWGPAIVGYGMYQYQTKGSSQKHTMPLAAFSPRKQSMTLYVMPSWFTDKSLFKKLGSGSTSRACLYIKRLADVDMAVLKQIIKQSYVISKKKLT